MLWTSILVSAFAAVHIAAAHGRRARTDSRPASHVDPRLSKVVTRLAHRRAVVVCGPSERRGPKLWGAATTGWNLDRVDLSPEICNELTRLSSAPRPIHGDRNVDALAWSVGVLAHESQHVRESFGEAEAECRGKAPLPPFRVTPTRYSPAARALMVWSSTPTEFRARAPRPSRRRLRVLGARLQVRAGGRSAARALASCLVRAGLLASEM